MKSFKLEIPRNNIDLANFFFSETMRCTDFTCKQKQRILTFSLGYFVFPLAISNKNLQIYRTIILPFAVCECETWSGTLREERRLMVMENKVLREMLEPERQEVFVFVFVFISYSVNP